MARPKKDEAKKQYTVMLEPSVVEEVDRIAKKIDLSRSQFMGNLIKIGLEDAKILEGMKVLDILKFAGNFVSKLKNDFISGKAKRTKDGEIVMK